MYRLALLTIWTILALPGVILNGPVFLIASIVSRKKAQGAVELYFCFVPCYLYSYLLQKHLLRPRSRSQAAMCLPHGKFLYLLVSHLFCTASMLYLQLSS